MSHHQNNRTKKHASTMTSISANFLLAMFCLFVSQCLATTTTHMAIARTFSPKDVDQLERSFDVWEEYPPCAGNPSAVVDLFLAYSQSLDDSVAAQAAVAGIKRKFADTSGWNDCVQEVHSFGVDIRPDQDIYKASEQDTNVLWVNGPNRQFERTVRLIQSGKFGSYDLMYLMEMDSVPIVPFWMDLMIEEIIARPNEFAILGSKYRGDKWDAFYSELPYALVNHINGNAIYNLTHPLFLGVLAQLESEASTVANSIPYDYRIAQIVVEVDYGVEASFVRFDADTPPVLPLPSRFTSWAKRYNSSDLITETVLIGNYASTDVVPEFFRYQGAVVHGAILHSAWEDSNLGNVSLIISDWNEVQSPVLLSELDATRHPFGRVIVMLPEGVTPPIVRPQCAVPIDFVHRGSNPDVLDLCTAPVASDWFMITDSYHHLRQNIRLMVHHNDDEGSDRPVIKYIKATQETCFSHPYCLKELRMANEISPSTERVYQSQDFVFHTAMRNEFCMAWRGNFTTDTPPSATSYVAFLKEVGQDTNLYSHADRALVGSRPPFLPLPSSWLPPQMQRQRRLQGGENFTDENLVHDCEFQRTETECVHLGCEWNGDFRSCREEASSPTNVETGNLSRPKRKPWVTALIVAGIAGGLIALTVLSIEGARHWRSGNTGSSLQVVSGDEGYQLDGDRNNRSQHVADVDDASMESIDLDSMSFMEGGEFREGETGVEFVANDVPSTHPSGDDTE